MLFSSWQVESSSDFYTSIGKGEVEGHQRVTFGAAGSFSNTDYVDLWGVPDTMIPLPTVAESLEILSDDANDNATGTGLRTVILQGLDSDYNEIAEVLTLNGTTPVPTVNQYLRTRAVTGITAGAKSGNNEGIITLQTVGGGAGSERQVMTPGSGVTFTGLYTVPNGKRALATVINVYAPRSDDIDTRILISPEGDNAAGFASTPVSLYQNAISLPLAVPAAVPAKADIKLQAERTSGGGTVSASISLVFILVDDGA